MSDCHDGDLCGAYLRRILDMAFFLRERRWIAGGGLCLVVGIVLLRRLRRNRDGFSKLTTPLSPPHLAEFADTSDDCQEILSEEFCDAPHVVVSPFLGLVYCDEEFSRWTLSRCGVWYDCTAADLSESSPSAIAEYVLGDGAERPRINIIAEDLMMMSCSAEEYVLRARQGLPTESWEINQLDALESSPWHSTSAQSPSAIPNEELAVERCYEGSTSAAGPTSEPDGSSWAADTVDFYCCSFTEPSDHGFEQWVANMVAVRRGVAVVLQLNCPNTESERGRHMELFERICKATLRQLRSSECDIVLRSSENFLQCGLPSIREGCAGVVMTLPVGLLQALPNTHWVFDVIQKKIIALNARLHSGQTRVPLESVELLAKIGVVIIAFVEKRSKGSDETIETYLIQFQRKSLFELVRSEVLDIDVGRRVAVAGREDLACLVVVVAGTQGAASNRACSICDMLQPHSQHRRFVQYAHSLSGVTCSLLPFMHATSAQPAFVAQYFGPFTFQAYPRGTSRNQPQFRISVREIRVGESLVSLQRQATKDYPDDAIVRRPCMEGWTRLDVTVLDSEGARTTEHVTMLQHHKWFVHLVYCSPSTQTNAPTTAINDELRRCLHLNSPPF